MTIEAIYIIHYIVIPGFRRPYIEKGVTPRKMVVEAKKGGRGGAGWGEAFKFVAERYLNMAARPT